MVIVFRRNDLMRKVISVLLVLIMILSILPAGGLAASANEGIAASRYFPAAEYYYAYTESSNAAPQSNYSDGVQAISNAISAAAASVNISSYGILTSQMDGIFSNEIYQNPEFFYLTGYSYSYNLSTNVVINVYPDYNDYSAAQILQMKTDYAAAVAYALSCIQPGMTNAEKALAMHEYLILNTKYDYENYLADTIPRISHTAYGILVNGVGVCNGYSLAFKDLMTRLGVTTIKVSSSTMQHAWNMVYLGGEWYHADVTWDDAIFPADYGWLNNDYDLEGRVEHDYFLLSDAGITSLNHSGWLPNTNIADSTIYDGDYSAIKSGMFYSNGYWYYNTGGSLTRSLFDLSNSTVIKTINGYDNFYSYLGVFNDKLYYNYNESSGVKSYLKRIDFDGTADTVVLTIDNTGSQITEKITELVIQDDIVKYTVCRQLADESNEYEIRYLSLWSEPVAREGSTAVVNPDNNLIYGLEPGLTAERFTNEFIQIIGNVHIAYTFVSGAFGTGTKVELIDNLTNEVVATYYIVIYGDVNGDGNINGVDVGIMVNVENYSVSWNPVTEAAFIIAGNINGDGNINGMDAGITVDVENYMRTLNQVTGLAV